MVTLTLLVPSALVAQKKQSKDEDKECEKAAKIVAKGHPEKKKLDALSTLSRCGVIGAAAMVSFSARQLNVRTIRSTQGCELSPLRRHCELGTVNLVQRAQSQGAGPAGVLLGDLRTRRHTPGCTRAGSQQPGMYRAQLVTPESDTVLDDPVHRRRLLR